jgi:hypothetical protein
VEYRLKNVKENKIKHVKSKRECVFFFLLSTILFFGLLAFPATAADWKMSPSNPHVGDTLKIKVTASPYEDVNVSVSHNMSLPVNASNGRYQLVLNNLPVAEWKNNLFTVSIHGVKNANIIDGESVFGHWIWASWHINAKCGNVTIVQRDPPITDLLFFDNKIIISGDALKCRNSVLLNVTVNETLTADSKGNFKFDYNTTALPAGEYILTIGNKTQKFELKENKDDKGNKEQNSQVAIPSECELNSGDKLITMNIYGIDFTGAAEDLYSVKKRFDELYQEFHI